MSAVIAPQVAREILALVVAGDGTDRALSKIAGDHGLMLPELRALIARRSTPLVRKVTRPADEPADVEASKSSKTCSACKTTQPATEFYPDPNNRDGRSSQCRNCNNRRRPTEARIVRNRARKRATALLIAQHRAEFAQALEVETAKAWAELARLAAEAEAQGQHDAGIARLKPGPKRKGQTDVTQRLDVARCPSCHTHHDDAHVCPTCGDETPREPEAVKPYMIRDWAIASGMAPVPTRGPLPERIVAAYHETHQAAS